MPLDLKKDVNKTLSIACAAVALVSAAGGLATAADAAKPARLLVVTVTAGFRHASIPTAEAALEEIGRANGLYHLDYLRMPSGRAPQPQAPKRAADTSDDDWKKQEEAFKVEQEKFLASEVVWQAGLKEQFTRAFAAESLANFDGVIFASTTGELPIPDIAVFLDWIKSGKAFAGFHAATDTLKSSDAYCDMVGGHFAGHPWNGSGQHAFVVHEPSHPLTVMLPERLRWQDEIYQYDPRYKPENLRVLVSLDMQASWPQEPWHVPVSWVREYGKGRVFYTNFGHNESTWREPRLRKHMEEGLAWALRRREAPSEPNPGVQAAEYLRSVIAAAAAAAGKNADDLRANAAAKIARDPRWAESLRPLLLQLRELSGEARGPVYAQVIAEIQKP